MCSQVKILPRVCLEDQKIVKVNFIFDVVSETPIRYFGNAKQKF
jgi:hypothetical protein